MLEPRKPGDMSYEPDYTLYHFPSLLPEPAVLISVTKKIILISGTLYSGEIKKSVFSVLNYHLPLEGILPMHCSVNTDITGKNAAVFFGLSGTGKTTLSSDPARLLLGDDEHSWSQYGLSNFEYGCYAKTINLSQKEEPQIWNDKLKNEIYDACKTIVHHEDAFIDLAFQMGSLEGLTAEEVKQYIRFIGNRRLEQLGLNPIYDVKKNPLTWLDTMLNGVEHMNFFEGRATEYSKASTRGTWGEVFA